MLFAEDGAVHSNKLNFTI